MKHQTFKDLHNLQQRKEEVERVLHKYPDRIPIICEPKDPAKDGELDKTKFLVPADLTVGQFLYVVRKRVNIAPEQAVYLFSRGKPLASGTLLSLVYAELKDPCGFLFITFTLENTFGSRNSGGARSALPSQLLNGLDE